MYKYAKNKKEQYKKETTLGLICNFTVALKIYPNSKCIPLSFCPFSFSLHEKDLQIQTNDKNFNHKENMRRNTRGNIYCKQWHRIHQIINIPHISTIQNAKAHLPPPKKKSWRP
jgi:hypothetical protein